MNVVRAWPQLVAPAVLIVVAALLGSLTERSSQIYFINALVSVAIVVALYVFVGNSGVVSFGHISFVAVGAWAAGVLAVPSEEKPAHDAGPRPASSATRRSGTSPRSRIAAAVGGVFALARGPRADAPLGPRCGDRDVRRARDHEQHPPLQDKIGPGLNVFSSVPGDDRPAAGDGRRAARDRRVAFVYQRSPVRAAAARGA